MIAPTVTLELPQTLYQRLRQKSRQRRSTVLQELYRFAENDADENTTRDVDKELLWLDALSDEMLWQVARSRVEQNKQDRMLELFDKRDESGLSEIEYTELDEILELGNRITLLRAESALLLKRRGYDVTELGPNGKYP